MLALLVEHLKNDDALKVGMRHGLRVGQGLPACHEV
jgi:hypothetical protein